MSVKKRRSISLKKKKNPESSLIDVLGRGHRVSGVKETRK